MIAGALPVIAHWAIVLTLGVRIMMRRRETGVALAWLIVIISIPLFGAAVYMLVGETWLARGRRKRAAELVPLTAAGIAALRDEAEVEWAKGDVFNRALSRYADRALDAPALTGNRIEVLDGAEPFFTRLIQDIDGAQAACRLMFYIWWPGGAVDAVEDALIRAAARGVDCLILVDAAGSRAFLGSDHHERLTRAGVSIVPLLPTGPFRWLLSRIDLRNHRKIVAIDRHTAYCGSMNMADPREFKADDGFGQWVDVMVRVEGPTADALDLTLAQDWALEEHDPVEHMAAREPALREVRGAHTAQVISSGPGQTPRGTLDTVLTMIYAARRELILTTPYFIPDESMLTALICAVRRGVSVTIILPERVDSPLVRLASRAFYADLLKDGAEIRLFSAGLLHAKTMTVDGAAALIGSANMDRRSFGVNFETSLFIYSEDVVDAVREVQRRYIEHAAPLDSDEWAARSLPHRLIENAVQVFAPIL